MASINDWTLKKLKKQLAGLEEIVFANGVALLSQYFS